MRIANLGGQTAVHDTEIVARNEGQPRTHAVTAAEAVDRRSRDREAVEAARAAFSDTPEVDAARVAQIRAAMDAGEIQFNAAKLAGVILRYHGGTE
jgi:negative regulator of flagellin synthesis FlgM